MPEMQYVIRKRSAYLLGFHELGKVNGGKTETEHINSFLSFGAVPGGVQPAGITFPVLLLTINISGDTEPQFKIILCGFCLLVVVSHHAQVVQTPLRIFLIPLYCILNGSGDLPLLLLNELKLFVHDRLLVSQGEYIRWLMHNRPQIYIAKGLWPTRKDR